MGQRWRTRREARIGDELRSHRDRLIEDYIVAGMDRSEAERRAFLEFGNVERSKKRSAMCGDVGWTILRRT